MIPLSGAICSSFCMRKSQHDLHFSGSDPSSGRKPLSSVEIYDSASKTWTAGPDLPNPRFGSVIVQYGSEEVSIINII